MPIKEYECEACHHKFEEIVWLNEPGPTACPKCGKGPLKRLLSTFRITGVSRKSKEGDEAGSGEFDESALGGGEDDLGGGDFGGEDAGDLGGDDEAGAEPAGGAEGGGDDDAGGAAGADEEAS